MPSTDTGPYRLGEGHPQIAGSFPRYFKKMVTERYELNIMEAVRKATLLPAETLGFNGKGRMREGFVNGRPAIIEGELFHTRAGKAVRCTEPVYDYQI